MGSKIFLSYAREDHSTVTELHRDLTTMGNEVFYDQELTGGQSWWSTLLQRIQQCDVFVPVVGTSWMESTPCRLEADYAHDLGKAFLPIVLGDVSAKLLPSIIAETQWVGYDPGQKDSVLSLARAVNTVPPSAALPSPLPTPPEVPISYLTELRERVMVRHDISRRDQDVLLAEIRRRVEAGADEEELAFLLESFRRRDDLNVHVANEIDLLLSSIRAPSGGATPPPPPPPEATTLPPPPEVLRPSTSTTFPPPDRNQMADIPFPPPDSDPVDHAPPNSATGSGQPGSGKLVVSYILSLISVFFLPIIFGPIAIVLAYSARKAGNPKGQTALVVAIAATIVGMILGAAIVLASGA